jgi:hypothetical protein
VASWFSLHFRPLSLAKAAPHRGAACVLPEGYPRSHHPSRLTSSHLRPLLPRLLWLASLCPPLSCRLSRRRSLALPVPQLGLSHSTAIFHAPTATTTSSSSSLTSVHPRYLSPSLLALCHAHRLNIISSISNGRLSQLANFHLKSPPPPPPRCR